MNNKGFSFVELLVTITIIAVITAVGVVSYSQVSKRSRDSRRVSDLEQFRSALELYKSDNSYYPSGGCGGATCTYVAATTGLAILVTDGYMPSIPTDPQGNEYSYQANTQSGSNYYGYCMSTSVELVPTQAPCTADGDEDPVHNYSVANP